ncbi:MAG TPA: retropepsin-like aspartic protease [Deferrisomatales bacterium]|nr:retropepsin-like aspartic protease [Deferrisomatales bacterium]
MRLLGAVVASVLLLLAATAAVAAEVPLEVRTGSLVVEANFNRRFTGRFLLDTGATYCVLGEEVARQARIKGRSGGEEIRLLTANGPVRAHLGEARKVELGRAAARNVAVAVVADNPVHGLDGIIGLSFLQGFVYTVDVEAGVLRLED